MKSILEFSCAVYTDSLVMKSAHIKNENKKMLEDSFGTDAKIEDKEDFR